MQRRDDEGRREAASGVTEEESVMFVETMQADEEREPARAARTERQAGTGIPKVSVVIPTLNEGRNLPYVLTRLPRDVHEVILVDGHSTDNTIEVARRLYPPISIISQMGRGKGNALACGFAACTGDIVVMLDADGSADPAEIPRFVAALLNGADFAKGSRFASGGGSVDITRLRAAGNWLLKATVNVLYGARYTDLCYGYNAFWLHCLPHVDPDADGFEIETLINIRAAKAGLTVHEVPSLEGHRVHGVSNLNAVRDGLRVLRTILWEFNHPHPLARPPKAAVQPGYGWDGVEQRRNGDQRNAGERPWHAQDVLDRRSGEGRRTADRSVLSYDIPEPPE